MEAHASSATRAWMDVCAFCLAAQTYCSWERDVAERQAAADRYEKKIAEHELEIAELHSANSRIAVLAFSQARSIACAPLLSQSSRRWQGSESRKGCALRADGHAEVHFSRAFSGEGRSPLVVDAHVARWPTADPRVPS
eukprot:6213061-Pleurochrysis_carterae.AAC.4